MRPLLALIVAYLLGSIPFGYLIVRAKEGADVRQSGSGGTGATNVSRRAGKLAGVVTLLLDALKGALAVALARWLLTQDYSMHWWVGAAAVAVVFGHIFPVWLSFHGGKGVATAVGAFIGLAPLAVVCAGIIFFLVVWLTRYVSFGSISAAVALPFYIWSLRTYARPEINFSPLITAAISTSALIIYAHRENIKRLARGTESKFK